MAADGNDKKQKKARVKLEYWVADDVEEIAKKLIPKHHAHLASARMKYLFRSVASKSGQKLILGRCAKITGRVEHLTQIDFLIEIAYDAWQQLSPNQREALVDHELCHAWAEEDDKTGEMKYQIRGHDVEEFSEVIKRHGLWTPDMEIFSKTLEDLHAKKAVVKPSTVKRDAVVTDVVDDDADEDDAAAE